MKKGTKQLSVDCVLWATAITVFVISFSLSLALPSSHTIIDDDVCEQLISMEKSR